MGCCATKQQPAAKTSGQSATASRPADPAQLKQIVAFLAEVPLFNGFEEEDCKLVADACQWKVFHEGEVVIRQGEISEEFFVIFSGEASVHLRSDSGSKQLAVLKDGDYFGEVALLHDSPRAATVKVESKELSLLVVSRRAFEDLKLRDKLFFPCRKAVGAARVAQAPKPEPTRKSPQEAELIKKALLENDSLPKLVDFTEARLERIVDFMWRESVGKGTDLIRQGDWMANNFYIVQEGGFDILQDKGSQGHQVLGKRSKGQSFGELAMLYATPRAATLRARVDSQVWVIDRTSFKRALVVEENPERLHEYVKVLGAVQTLSTLLLQERQALAQTLVEVQFDENEVILREGDPGDCMFVLCQGEVVVSVNGEEKARLKQEKNPVGMWGTKKALTFSLASASKRPQFTGAATKSQNAKGRVTKKSKLPTDPEAAPPASGPSDGAPLPDPADSVQAGTASRTRLRKVVDKAAKAGAVTETLRKASVAMEVFGERAMVSSEPRSATVTAVNGPVMALRLDVDSCNVVLGPLEDLLKRGRFGGQAVSRRFGQIYKADLQTLGLLGAGGFGAVYLVEHLPTKETYALKAISKGYIVQCGMEEGVKNEKKILMMVNSPFIIKLYETFNGGQSIYFLMETALGGELFATYNRRKFFGSAKHAQFYTGGAICALEYLHSRRIVYRDLKPENLMITHSGQIKLIDMGLAKVVIGKTFTTCGTPDYFAPEILDHSGHNHAVDWWTVGILTYELMTGAPPFESADAMETYAKIKKGIFQVTFPASCPGPCKSIVRELCQHKAEKRLGVMCGGVRKIREHPWFAGFTWEDFMALTMDPPYKPAVQGCKDVANFKVNQTELPRQIAYTDPGTGWDKDFATGEDKPPAEKPPELANASLKTSGGTGVGAARRHDSAEGAGSKAPANKQSKRNKGKKSKPEKSMA